MTQLDFVEDDGPVFAVHRACRKPTEVEAVRASTDNLDQVVAWIEDADHHAVLGDGQLIVQTLDGPFTVRPGDYVIRQTPGGFSRCDAEVYAESYDDLGPAR